MTGIFDQPIVHAVFIRSDREKVYDAITTAEGLDGWFTQGAEIDARPGGRILFRWHEWGPDKVTDTAGGPVLEAKRPERFVFQWWEDHYTTVEMDFEAVEGGTILRVREHGYADTAEGRRRCLLCATGWGEALTLIKFYVEHGIRY
jgi:uncharacterized protein YndB with AHSA1/START domain